MAQNAGANQGGFNKTQDKSADSKRRQGNETGDGKTAHEVLQDLCERHPGSRQPSGASPSLMRPFTGNRS